LTQQIAQLVIGDRMFLEQAVRRGNDLIRGHAPAGSSAHAVGDDSHHGAGVARTGQQSHTVLLLSAIADVIGDTGGDFEAGAQEEDFLRWIRA
jgi:hypothetical protein